MSDFRTSEIVLTKFESEALEPTAQHCIGRWFHNCELSLSVKKEIEAKCKAEKRDMTFHEYLDSEVFWSNCSTMWFGLVALTKLSIACDGAIHYCIALQNEKSKIAKYIDKHLGFDPILDKKGFGF